MEKQLTKSFDVPKDYLSALRMLVSEVEQRELLSSKVAELEPKAIAFDAFINGDGFYNMNSVAKILSTGRNRLFQRLREKEVLMKNNIPYQQYVDRGLFVVKACTKNGLNMSTTLVSPKGLNYISQVC